MIKKTILRNAQNINYAIMEIRKICRISASQRLWKSINCFLNAKKKHQQNFNLAIKRNRIGRRVKINNRHTSKYL